MHRIIKVLIDGQAWLYANQLKLQAEQSGQEVYDKQFQQWMDEWKVETANLIGGDNGEEALRNDSGS